MPNRPLVSLAEMFMSGSLPRYGTHTFPVFIDGSVTGFYIDPQAFLQTVTIQ